MPLYEISFVFRDEGNDSASTQFYVNAADEAAAVTRAETLAALLDELTAVIISSVKVSRNLSPSVIGLKTTPTPDYDVEKGQRLIFGTDFTGVNPYVTIPAIKFENGDVPPKRLVSADGKLNDTASQWDDLFTEIFTTGDYEDFRGADITTLRDNYEVHEGKARGR